jgi:hypothetical protein
VGNKNEEREIIEWLRSLEDSSDKDSSDEDSFDEDRSDEDSSDEDSSDEDSFDEDSSDEDTQEPAVESSDEYTDEYVISTIKHRSDEGSSDEDSSDEDSSDEDSSDEDTQEPAEDGGNESEEGEYKIPPGAKAGNEILLGSDKFVVPFWYKECGMFNKEWFAEHNIEDTQDPTPAEDSPALDGHTNEDCEYEVMVPTGAMAGDEIVDW